MPSPELANMDEYLHRLGPTSHGASETWFNGAGRVLRANRRVHPIISMSAYQSSPRLRTQLGQGELRPPLPWSIGVVGSCQTRMFPCSDHSHSDEEMGSHPQLCFNNRQSLHSADASLKPPRFRLLRYLRRARQSHGVTACRGVIQSSIATWVHVHCQGDKI